MYIIIFLDPLLKGQKKSTLKQIIFLETRIKYIIIDYNRHHIMQELHTKGKRLSLHKMHAKRTNNWL